MGQITKFNMQKITALNALKFSLLGLIYNDNLHVENKSRIDCRETLYSRLENDTIREMIRSVVTGKVKVV